ncbi:MAG TPA: hypothetical protein VMU56_06085 [Beijerinckiaceae bacterium]|nr:hypothetical protein [Beijerinckiaceae bacterium]
MSDSSQGGAAPVGERVTRLEALLEAFLFNQMRREREDAQRRRDAVDEQRDQEERDSCQRDELTNAVQDLVSRLERMEPIVIGDSACGKKPIDERIKAIEETILSARVGWRTTVVMGTGLLGLVSALLYVLHWLNASPWTAHQPRP